MSSPDTSSGKKDLDKKKAKESMTVPLEVVVHGERSRLSLRRSLSASSTAALKTGDSARSWDMSNDGVSSEKERSHSKKFSRTHLMEEFRKAISDSQHVESLIAQNHSVEAWSKALLWAFASGQTGFVALFLERSPPDLRSVLQTAKDADKFTSLHRAVVAGKVKIIETVMQHAQFEHLQIFKFLHARTPEGWTALHLAVAAGDEKMVTALRSAYDNIALPPETEWDFADNFWLTPLHYAVLGKLPAIVELLLGWKTFEPHLNAHDYFMRTAAHMASSHIGAPIDAITSHREVDLNAVDCCSYTPLHWAVYVGATDAVRCLIAQAEYRTIRTTEDDIDGWPVLQIAIENTTIDRKVGKDIEKLLLTSSEVKDDVERLYRDRQVYVDAANAILVGAALISSVTFGGFLQPPTGNDMALAHRELRVFWALNSLSFFFSIATVMAGAGAVLPLEDVYIGKAVGKIRIGLALTSFLLIVSVVFVLGAFAASGFASSTAFPHLRGNMIVTTSIGAAICAVILLWFLVKLYRVFPDWRRSLGSIPGIWQHAMIEKGLRNSVEILTELNAAATRADEKMQKKHVLIYPDLKHVHLTPVVFDLAKASQTETHVRQHANDPMGIVENRTTWIHHVKEKILEQRIKPFEDAYERARLKKTEKGETQDPTLNMVILNNLGPRGVHYWIQPFPSSYCRPHCLKKDRERWTQIRDRVLARKKPSLEEECVRFEFGTLGFEEWVPIGKPS